jgi:hypothetical protein
LQGFCGKIIVYLIVAPAKGQVPGRPAENKTAEAHHQDVSAAVY